MVFNRIIEKFGKPQNHQIISLFKIQKKNNKKEVSNSKIVDILNEFFPNVLTSLKILEFINIHNLSELHIQNTMKL